MRITSEGNWFQVSKYKDVSKYDDEDIDLKYHLERYTDMWDIGICIPSHIVELLRWSFNLDKGDLEEALMGTWSYYSVAKRKP